ESAVEVSLSGRYETKAARSRFRLDDGSAVVVVRAQAVVLAISVSKCRHVEGVVAALVGERERGERKGLVIEADAVIVLVRIVHPEDGTELGRLQLVARVGCAAEVATEDQARAARVFQLAACADLPLVNRDDTIDLTELGTQLTRARSPKVEPDVI